MKTITADSIPVELMSKAVQTIDIRQIMIKDRKKNNIPADKGDVMVLSPFGDKQRITRKELVQTYVDTKGQRIALRTLRYDTQYTVMRGKQADVYAVKVPMSKNIKVVLSSGKMVKPGNYLIYGKGEAGPDPMDIKEVDSKMFKKMFRIEQLPELSRRRDSSGRTILGSQKSEESNDIVSRVQSRGASEGEKSNSKKKGVVASGIENQKNVKVVAQLQDKNTYELIGFVCEANGERGSVSKAAMKSMCRRKAVVNMKLVDRNGTKFLEGIKMRIPELPVEYGSKDDFN